MSTIGLDENLLVAMYGSPDGWSGLSASGAGPANECPARLALPAARTSSDAADRGTELHEFARVVTMNPAGRAQALLDMPEKWRHTAAGMNIELALDGLKLVGCEKAYALDVKNRTCRYIGENIERAYEGELARRLQKPLSRYEIPFSIDVEAFYGETPVELDYKSGQHIGEVSEHWQRRICATGLMFFHGTATAISRVAYIWDSGEIKHDGTEFSILDAEDYCDTLVATIDRVWKARLQFANGVMPEIAPSDSACAYCPAMMSCPNYTNFAKAMLGKLEAVEKGPELSTLTPEELGQVWAMGKKAEKILEPLFKSLKKIAAETPLPVGEDKEVRRKTRSNSYFDDSKARGLIVTLLGRLGHGEDEIQNQLMSLSGKTEYEEFRTVKKAS